MFSSRRPPESRWNVAAGASITLVATGILLASLLLARLPGLARARTAVAG